MATDVTDGMRDARGSAHRRLVVPRSAGASLAEVFLVVAIATVLLVRGYLWATGYPKVGGGGIHVAHVLWGGLFMLVGLLIIFLRVGLPAMRLGAFLAGIGFGLFIDEVGKFLTSNVNYFFQWAWPIIYAVFVAIALLLAVWRRRLKVDQRTALANALSMADVAIHDPAAGDQRQAVLALLAQADGSDPLVPALAARVRQAEALLGGYEPTRWQRARMDITAWYRRVTGRPWFDRALVGLFAVLAAWTLTAMVLALLDPGDPDIGVADSLQAVGSLTAAVLMVIGLFTLFRSRVRAYRWFERAVLVDLLITEVFAFYMSPGWGVLGVVVDLLLLVSLRFAIAREQESAGRG